VDLGKVLGATVIATTGRAEKLDALRQAGADHALLAPGFRDEVKALTGGRGRGRDLRPGRRRCVRRERTPASPSTGRPAGDRLHLGRIPDGAGSTCR
jgi:hypothetical protein